MDYTADYLAGWQAKTYDVQLQEAWEVAKELSQKTGGKVLAAKDGMKFDLSQLDNIGD